MILKENGTIYYNSKIFDESFFANNSLQTWKKHKVD